MRLKSIYSYKSSFVDHINISSLMSKNNVKFVRMGNCLPFKNLLETNITFMHQQLLKWANVKYQKK
jgi:hypothetical protein